MGNVVIAAYRPRAGQEAELLELLRGHLPILRQEGLVTDRPALVMRAADGTILEIFEWTSAAAMEEAHRNKNVQAMWRRFDQVCSYETLANLRESQGPFAHFEQVPL